MFPPRSSRGAKPLMSAPPVVAPASSGGVQPDPFPGQSDRVNYYARQVAARGNPGDYRTARLQNMGDQAKPMRPTSSMVQDTWNQGGVQAGPVEPGFQDVASRLGSIIESGPVGEPMPQHQWDGTMFGVRLPSSQDSRRQIVDETNMGGGVTAGPSVTGPGGGIPGLPGYDPNANVQGTGGPPASQPVAEGPQRIPRRIVRAAEERPLMGRRFRP